MELTVEKHEYEEIEVTKIGSDLQTTLKALNLKFELEVQPYQILNDLVGEMSKFYGKDEMQEILQELIQRWY
jgi:hypothetical protein